MLTPAVLFALFLVFLGLTWTLSLAESAFSYLSRRDAEDIVLSLIHISEPTRPY